MKTSGAIRLTTLFTGTTLLLLGATIAALSLLINFGVGHVVRSAQQAELESQLASVRGIIQSEARAAEMMATLVANVPLFNEAMDRNDRKTLLHQLQPAFKNLQSKYGARQFQFHTPPATSMLRIHKPEKYGDDLSLFRRTVVETNTRRQSIGGLEKGVAGLGIRGVTPVFHDGEHIGSVEFGFAVNSALSALRVSSRLRARIYIVSDDRPRVIGTTHDNLPSGLDTEALKQVYWGKPIYTRISTNTGTTAILAASLLDFSDKPIGVIEVFPSNDETGAVVQEMTGYTIGIAICMMLAGGFFSYRISRSVSSTLSNTAVSLRNIASGNPSMNTARTPLAERIMETRQVTDTIDALHSHIGAILDESRDQHRPLPQSIAETLRAVAREATLVTERQSNDIQQLSEESGAIGETIERLSEYAGHAAETSHQVADEVTEGSQKAEQARQSVEHLAKEINSIREAVQGLKGNADSISQVLAFISNVTEQTNLLALNAAIESARAGEAGRGFAVVADEVRTLAQRTQEATVDIEERINALHQGVDATNTVINAIHNDALQGVKKVEETHDFIQTMSEKLTAAGEANIQAVQHIDAHQEVLQRISAHIQNLSRSVHKTRQLGEQTKETAEKMVCGNI